MINTSKIIFLVKVPHEVDAQYEYLHPIKRNRIRNKFYKFLSIQLGGFENIHILNEEFLLSYLLEIFIALNFSVINIKLQRTNFV